jgi:predicted nucleotidyltransferase
MADLLPADVPELPPAAAQATRAFVTASIEALGEDLESVVLYGSGAEGRLRASSDVNLILVLRRFASSGVDRLREPLRVAQAAIRLAPMFLRRDEIDAVAAAFAAKFADVRRRHRVLFGPDPFAGLVIPREAEIFRLKQVLLNLTLRLRSLYATRGLRQEQLALVVADAAAPLRSVAASLRELEGEPPLPGKEALAAFAASAAKHGYRETLAALSAARETRLLPAGSADVTMLQLLELTEALGRSAAALS